MMYQNKVLMLNRRIPNLTLFWLALCLFLLIFSFIIIKIPFIIKYSYPGFITKIENEYYVKIYSTDKEVGKLNSKEVFINGKKYSLAYTKIKEAYTISGSLEIYHEVYLCLSLPKSLKIENNKVEVLFEIEKTTLLDMFIKNWKQGVYETIR